MWNVLLNIKCNTATTSVPISSVYFISIASQLWVIKCHPAAFLSVKTWMMSAEQILVISRTSVLRLHLFKWARTKPLHSSPKTLGWIRIAHETLSNVWAASPVFTHSEMEKKTKPLPSWCLDTANALKSLDVQPSRLSHCYRMTMY